MQACPRQNASAGDLGGGCGPKGGLASLEMAEAGVPRGLGTQQRAKGAPVHGADRASGITDGLALLRAYVVRSQRMSDGPLSPAVAESGVR